MIGIEACGTYHHWDRELMELRHQTRIRPPTFFKPYVNGAVDGEAICEAATRPTMRFVTMKVDRAAGSHVHRYAIFWSSSGHSW
jgi:transposase